jgi:Phosphotransferase enzyme family
VRSRRTRQPRNPVAQLDTSGVDERPGRAIQEFVSGALGARPASWRAVTDRGYTNNQRWLVSLGDGRSAFVKVATDDRTTTWLRNEHLVYGRLACRVLPDLLGWQDNEELTALLLEDLNPAVWPPPWSSRSVNAVLDALQEIGNIAAPDGLPRLEDERAEIASWRSVAADAEPFLALGLCSADWLDSALPALLLADDAAILDGDTVVHCDVRSDNICIKDGRARLFDWNWTTVGNSLLDLAAWAPSLCSEGGPRPEEIVPTGTADLAALVAGYFAARAGLPVIPSAPRVREVQLSQLEVALPWAARALGLPAPEPARWGGANCNP